MSETNTQRLAMAAQILSGLLASGHYTGEHADGMPYVKALDKDWEDHGCHQRYLSCAVDDAGQLLIELEAELARSNPADANS